MTPEEKAKKEAEEAAAKAAEEKAKAEDSEGDDPDEGEDELDENGNPIDKSIDYEAELKKEKEAREKAEKALAEKRFKDSERKRKGEDPDEGLDDGDKPLTTKELEKVLARERAETEKKLNQEKLIALAGKYGQSEAERNLILELHRGRTFPSHMSPEEQIEECFIIANKKKIIGENSELRRALKGKKGVVTNPADTHHDAPNPSEPKMSPQDKSALEAAGYKFNVGTRRFEKKLPNGDLLVKDPKTKAVFVVPKS